MNRVYTTLATSLNLPFLPLLSSHLFYFILRDCARVCVCVLCMHALTCAGAHVWEPEVKCLPWCCLFDLGSPAEPGAGSGACRLS